MIDEFGNKKCPRCGEPKLAVTHFYSSSARDGDGFGGYCKPCVKAKAVEWQKANPEKKIASDRRQWERPERKAKGRVFSKRYRDENPDKVHAQQAAWRAANPEKDRERTRGWSLAHPERVRKSQAKYHAKPEFLAKHAERHRSPEGRAAENAYRKRPEVRAILRQRDKIKQAKRRTGGGDFTRADWNTCLDAFAHCCAYCGRSDLALTAEHVQPVSRGALTVRGNIIPACQPCNSRKSSRLLHEFVPPMKAEQVLSVITKLAA